MNKFSSTESPGLLKDTYGDSGLEQALAKKRAKLAHKRLGLEVDEQEKPEDDNAE